MNVLLTSAGRRVALLGAFREAAQPGRLFAGDRDALAPALYHADEAFRLPEVTEEAYVPHLLDLVARRAIGLLVPTIDSELPKLAEAAAAFEARQCRVAISTPAFVEMTADKWETLQAFAAAGFDTVASWLPGSDAALPARLVVKPRRGSASRHVLAVPRSTLDAALALVPEAIIQEALTAPEITVDALFDFAGRLLHFVPRLRLKTLAGESIQGVTLREASLDRWLAEVLAHAGTLGARGPLTLQAFLTDGGPRLSEINARFGGGFPLTRAAGGDYPAWLVQLAHGEPVAPRLGQYRAGLYMTRHHTDHFLETPRWR